MIAKWMQQLGWTKPPAVENTAVRLSAPKTPQAAPIAQTAPENVPPKTPAAPSIDPEQMQQLTRSLTTRQQTVLQLAAGVKTGWRVRWPGWRPTLWIYL